MSGGKKSKVHGKSSALKAKWKRSPISSPVEYVNSVAISDDGGTVVAGTYFFPYAGGAKHSPADAKLITVGTFAWNAKGKSLWSDEFQATEGVYWVALSSDGQWAAGCGRSAPAEGFVYIYKVATGKRVFSFNTKVRVNMVAFSSDGTYLVAGADDLYLFSQSGSTWSLVQALPCPLGDSVVAVSISRDGQWIVAGTYRGVVNLVQNVGGTLGSPSAWQLSQGSVRWIALSGDGSAFVVAGSDSKAHFFKTSGVGVSMAPTWSASLVGCRDCRGVAINADGSLVSAVGNNKKVGKVFLFSDQGTSGKKLWVHATKHNPNSTSMDAVGSYVSVADGYPDGSPGDFYLFRGDGSSVGRFQTGNMSWPMQISNNAAAVATGSDDSYIYYFALA
jgi:WD40 repeat protein